MRNACVPTNESPAIDGLRDELGNYYTRERLERRVARAIVRARISQAGTPEAELLNDHVLESPDLLCAWVECALDKRTDINWDTISHEQLRDFKQWQEELQQLYTDSVRFIENSLKEPYCPDCEALGNETLIWPQCEKHGRELEWR